MHIHILGICGTFMGGLAILARQLGHTVSGCDSNVYPPMSDQLEEQGITLTQGYDPAQLNPAPDMVVIGNAMSRGNPCVEYVLDRGLAYTSGPEWLSRYVLRDRWVLACAGTHGKTTTASMLAWVLEFAGMSPGYLIGGVPGNFKVSARCGETPFFVIEADEYDSAFFDKRSKFVHYHPRTLILNNLEFDHADIFEDLAAIQKQFHHLVRLVPSIGRIIAPIADTPIEQVLEKGLWSECERTILSESGQGEGHQTPWRAALSQADGSEFSLYHQGAHKGSVSWNLTGEHNVNNALSAIAAAYHVGVKPEVACAALCRFNGVKRRMELLAEINGVCVYDDFAHHPTAIATTLAGLRAKVGAQRIIAVIEPRSNTMRMGVHRTALNDATAKADQVIWYQAPQADWLREAIDQESTNTVMLLNNTEDIVNTLICDLRPNDHIVIMSNGGFNGIHLALVNALKTQLPHH